MLNCFLDCIYFICFRFACSLLREGMKQIIVTLDNAEVRAAEEFGDKESVAKVSYCPV